MLEKTREKAAWSSVPFLVSGRGDAKIGWFTYTIEPAGYRCCGIIHKLFLMHEGMEPAAISLDKEVVLYAATDDEPQIEEEEYLSQLLNDYHAQDAQTDFRFKSAVPYFLIPMYEVAYRAAKV